MCHKVAKTASAICYILSGLSTAVMLSLLACDERLAAALVGLLAGLLVWYAADEKKTAPGATNTRSCMGGKVGQTNISTFILTQKWRNSSGR